MNTKIEFQMNAFITFLFDGTDVPHLSRLGRLKPFLKRTFLFLIVPFTFFFSLITMIFNERWRAGILYLCTSKENGEIDYLSLFVVLPISLLPGLIFGVFSFLPSYLMILLGRLQDRKLVFWLALTPLLLAPFDYWILPGFCFWIALIIVLFSWKTSTFQ